MNKEDLQKFCGVDDVRDYLNRPWSRDKHTFASNGHIIIAVPRLEDVPENDNAADAIRLFNDAKVGEWLPVPETAMPPELKCPGCEGSGKWEEDGIETMDCEDCDGKGKVSDWAQNTQIGPARFANRYLALIQGWEIAPTNHNTAAPIRNGDVKGLLMPIRVAT